MLHEILPKRFWKGFNDLLVSGVKSLQTRVAVLHHMPTRKPLPENRCGATPLGRHCGVFLDHGVFKYELGFIRSRCFG